MERAILHSDLKKDKIQPGPLIKEYLELLENDIKTFFTESSLYQSSCPVSLEESVSETFIKMNMQYNRSATLGNIYLSPRPKMKDLKRFYQKSEARNFWLTKLWPQTQMARQEKIIMPQLEWAKGFITQYFGNPELLIAEFYANHWGYFNDAKTVFRGSKYFLIEPFFDLITANSYLKEVSTTEYVNNDSLDAVFLFEAIDRSSDPIELMMEVSKSLKKGGLCFITSLLSTGFEVQILGEKSEIFVPPERMNILSFEGMNELVEKSGNFEVLEFSTPGVFDISNVIEILDDLNNASFFKYIFNKRSGSEIKNSFQEYLQMNQLGTFSRLVLRKK